MENPHFKVEPICLFSESSIWDFNENYYQKAGLGAWQENVVPHQMTSNSMVGKTYASVILGLLRDLSFKNKTAETVYIVELGAGHGRLAFHILQHLEYLTADLNIKLPPYCYVISDIVADSFPFFLNHPQLKSFFEQGKVDVAYFNATDSETLDLLHSKRSIARQDLDQPLVLVANYFFDSLPTDLFYVKDKNISACMASLECDVDPETLEEEGLIEHMSIKFFREKVERPFYEDPIYNEILDEYKNNIKASNIFFPTTGFQCLSNLQKLSKQGVMLLSMDKGYHRLEELEHKETPDLIFHGSFSIWVNYHAFELYCQKKHGKALLPSSASFYSPVVCLLLLPDPEDYKETVASYENHINRFGPDDFNGIKHITYQTISRLNMKNLMALIRLSHYDSTFFTKLLPRIKQLIGHISVVERTRLGETLTQIWNMYFNISEPLDLAYEIGGLFYDLGYYQKALVAFAHSTAQFGDKADVYYNSALCHYQLKEDAKFEKVKEAGKVLFPEYARFGELDGLDMG